MKLSKAQDTRYAFTIVEVLAVISIMALLAALVIGLQGRVKGKAEESRLMTEMAGIELALENYKAANGNYPPSNPWGSKAYPVADWSGAAGQDNQLYLHLVGLPTSQQKSHFCPMLKRSVTKGMFCWLPLPMAVLAGNQQNGITMPMTLSTIRAALTYGLSMAIGVRMGNKVPPTTS